MNYALDCESEDDGRWLAGMLPLSGVPACDATREEVMAHQAPERLSPHLESARAA